MKKIFLNLLVCFLISATSFAQVRYWVNGSGNWNDLAHWSTSSNGAGGASVPSSNNDVIIDNNSFSSTGGFIIINEDIDVASLDISSDESFAFKGKATRSVTVRGDVNVNANTIWAFSGNINLTNNTESNVKINTKLNSSLIFNGNWKLSSDIDASSVILQSGNFFSNNFNIVANKIVGNKDMSIIDLGSTTVAVEQIFFENTQEISIPENSSILSLSTDNIRGNVKIDRFFFSDLTFANHTRALGVYGLATGTATDPTCETSTDGTILIDYPGASGSITWEVDDFYGLYNDRVTNTNTSHTFTGLQLFGNASHPYVWRIYQGVTLLDYGVLTLSAQTSFDGEIQINSNVDCNDNPVAELEANPIGGQAVFTYAWSTGANTKTVSNLNSGAYTVTITDGVGCYVTVSETLIAAPVVASSTIDQTVTCNGGSDGAATISATGGTGIYTYSWSDGGNGLNRTDLIANNYTVTVEDDQGCQGTTTVNMTEPATAVTASHTVNNHVQCFGGSDGDVTINVSNGTAPYTYAWSDGGNGANRNDLTANNYTVTVTDTDGCNDTENVTVTQPGASVTIAVDASGDASCFGVCDGTATVSATNGTGPYTFTWSDSGSGATRANLCGGNNDVTVTDANGCTDNTTIVTAEPLALTVVVAKNNDATCSGGCDGEAAALRNGGTGPYTYLWSNGGTALTNSSLCEGTSTVTVTDANSCTVTGTVVINEPNPIVITIDSQTDALCNGSSDGTTSLSSTGGDNGPYTYAWTGGGTGATRNDLSAGSYTVTSTDASGCTGTTTVTIGEPASALSVSLDASTNVNCNGGSDGTATVSGTGGTSPYTYAWSDGGSGATRNDLSAGNHTVTITDANSCTSTVGVPITEPGTGVSIAIDSQTDALCSGSSDGTATVSASGGAGPYTYAWGDGDTNASRNDLSAGNHTVTVTDANGCTDNTTVVIGEPVALTVVVAKNSDATCSGGCDGEAAALRNGGTAPYTYLWSNGGTTLTNSTLCEGTSTVTVTDANSCSTTGTVVINEPFPIVITIDSQTDALCNGSSDGTASLSSTGGDNGPYTYAWTGGGTGATRNDLSAGNHTVTSTDASGCTGTTTVTIGEPALAVSLSLDASTNVNCNGGSDGTATVSGAGGTSPYTYAWSDGGSGATRNDLSAGNHTVTVTDVNSCTSTVGVPITEPGIGVTITIDSQTDALCNGSSDGTATVSASGGTGPYTYSWGDGDTNASRNDLSSGNNDVTVTDANGCTDNTTVVIGEPVALTVLVAKNQDATCSSGCDGEAAALRNGGTAPYTYLWDNGVTTLTNASLCEGTASVTVTDANSCTVTGTVVINEPSPIVISIDSQTDALCNGSSDGTASLSSTGGDNGPYTYAWTGGGTGATRNDLSAGSYTVTSTDASGCTGTTTVIIGEPALAVSVSLDASTNVSCNGGSDGTATVSGAGGTSPYTYAWSDGGSGATRNDLSAGNHTVTITDANSCTSTVGVPITEPATGVTIAIDSQTDALCNGSSDGTATVSASGGTGPYTYAWGDGDTNTSRNDLSAGNNDVTVTDANGCTDNTTVVIGEPVALTVLVAKNQDATCSGGCDGEAAALRNGGTAPYTYLWDNGVTTLTNASLCEGTASVTVTDANSCTVTGTVVINEPSPIVITIDSQTDALCNGSSDGTANLSSTGGDNGPYTYAWTGGGTGATRNDLSAGSYTVTSTDASGCTGTETVTIGEPALALSVSLDASTNVNCNGGSDGTATVSGAGGTSPYTYAWSDGGTGAIRNNLSAGNHTVTVTDANSCTSTVGVPITEPATGVTIAIDSQTDALCNGSSDGTATVSASGGTGPYTYAWGDGDTNATRTDLSAGNNDVTVTDANGCTDNTTIVIGEPVILTVAVTKNQDATCSGGCDGEAIAVENGGTAPYSYLWSDGGTLATNSGLCEGTADITITDANSCTVTGTVVINEPAPVVITIDSQTDALCNGSSDGTASLSSTGGDNGPYSYAWTGGGTGATRNDLSAGSYTVTSTDASGCTGTTTVTIGEPALALSVSLDASTNVNCNGGSDGTATVSGAGGTEPYTYAWSDGGTGATRNDLLAGNHTVTITDANSCTSTTIVTITEPVALLSIAIDAQTDVVCSGQANGTATVSASGGTGPYTFAWGDGDTNASRTDLSAGNHDVTATDANGCTDNTSIIIGEPLPLTVIVAETKPASCNGVCDGEGIALGSGGNGGFTYLWDNGVTTLGNNSLCGGLNSVTVTDSKGCTAENTGAISQPDPVVITIDSQTDALCKGDANGTVSLRSTGGDTGPYTYAWDDAGVGATRADLSVGTYVVTSTDGVGCTGTTNVIIGEPAVALSMNFISSTNVTCNGLADGAAEVEGVGGTGLYTYAWSDGGTGAIRNDLLAGSHNVTVTDANLCTHAIVVNITEPIVLALNIDAQTDVLCNGDSNGTTDISGSGGTGPYSYEWFDGVVITSRSDLPAGSHDVTVTDFNSCQATTIVIIAEPLPLSVVVLETKPATCKNACDAEGIALGTGGAPGGYSYLWDNGVTTLGNNSLCGGPNSVTVTDVNGCTAENTANISQPDSLQVSITDIQHVSCKGGNDGAITVTGLGGSAPFTYAWDGLIAGEVQSNLTAGRYAMTITDANLCSTLDTIDITEPADGLTALIDSQSDALCKDSTDGTAVITGSGGTSPYTYLWPDAVTDSARTDLADGSYEITVADVNACPATVTLTIGEPATAVVASNTVNSNVTCNGLSDGDALISGVGGTVGVDYTYLWPDATVLNTNTTLVAGNYIATVTDDNGCFDTTLVVITEPDAILISFLTDSTSCSNSSDGRSRSDISGGTEPYTYNWSTGDTDTLIENVVAGVYGLTITDANGCTANLNDTVYAPDTIKISADIITNASCNGATDGGITTSISGGTLPYGFAWNSGETTQDIASVPAGTYKLTVTDANVCIDSLEATITEPGSLTIDITDSTHITCFGANDGTAIITPAGGTAPYTYNWTDGQSDSTAIDLTPGKHYVTVSDANGCNAIDSVEITEPADLAGLMVIDTVISCSGATTDGTIHIGATGGTEPYTYAWLGLGTDSLETGLGAGKYYVTLTDANLCTYNDSITLTEPDVLEVTNIVATPTACAAATGTAKVTASGGTMPYTYLWSNAETTDSISNLIVDFYQVTITDANDCTIDTVVEVQDTSTFDIWVTAPDTSVRCIGGADGSAIVHTTGGTAPFTYTWDNGDTNGTITGLSAGDYTVTVADINLCSRVAAVTITTDSVLVMSFDSVHQVSCFGANDGAIVVSAQFGTAPYTYTWSNGEANDTITGLVPGKYIVTIQDAAGCNVTDSVIITEPLELAGAFTGVSDIACFGSCDGEASYTLTLGTGTAPYLYNWADGQTDSTATGLCGGYHPITITDANNCELIDSIQINDATTPLAFTYDSTLATCGKSDGELIAHVTGGVKPFAFAWSNGATDSTNSVIPAGVYFLTVTDANGCSDSNYVALNDTSDVTINSFTAIESSCNPCQNSLTVNATGGTDPYTYLWSNGDTDITATNLCVDLHTVTVTDVNGCQATGYDSINLDNPLIIVISETKPVGCPGSADAEAKASVTGGIAPYTYTWSNGSTDSTSTDLASGKYYVTIEDAGACSVTDSITITEPLPIITNVVLDTAITCFGDTAGVASVSVSGGTEPYTYTWTGGSTDTTSTKLSSGWAYVTIEDAGGCTKVDSIEITEPELIVLDSVQMTPSACGGTNGSAIVYISGGTVASDYTYAWSTGAVTDTIQSVGSGIYDITVADDNGCQLIESIEVTDSSDLSLDFLADSDAIRCDGDDAGIATLSIAGGTEPYDILWSTGDTTLTVDSLLAGDYTVTVTDSNTCERSGTVTIVEDLILTVDSMTIDHIACAGSVEGSATIYAGGGYPPYSYAWTSGDTLSIADSLIAGKYYVTVSDTAGCSIIDSVEIMQPSSLTGTFISATDILCAGSCTGEATYSVSGGQEPYDYTWSNGDTDTIADSLCVGYVYLTVTDANGCSIIDSVEIEETTPPMVFDSVMTDIAHCGLSNAEARLYVSGGEAPYTYTWNTGATDDTLANVPVGIYFATVADTNNCTIDTVVIISDTSDVSITTVEKTEPHCDPCDASATIIATGGTGNYTYDWSTGTTDSTSTDMCAGMFTATVTDDDACSYAIIDTIFDNSIFDLTLSVTAITCSNADDGILEALTSGGTGEYTYLWSTGDTRSIIDSLSAGKYYVTVSDTVCSITDSVELVNPDSLIVETMTEDAICFGQPNGIMEITSTNGVVPDSYIWPNGIGSERNSSLYAGTYTVTVTYNTNCSIEVTDTVGQPDLIIPTLAMEPSFCGQDNGEASVSVTGGITPYTYQWFNYGMEDSVIVDDTNDTIMNLPVDFYWVEVTDSNNCVVNTDYIYVPDTNNFTLNVIDRHEISCIGRNDGSITIEGTSEADSLEFLWYKFYNGVVADSSISSTTAILDSVYSGDYKVYVTDTNNCTSASLVNFNLDYVLSINYFSVQHTSCKEEMDGATRVHVGEGTPRVSQPYYDYLWSKDSITIDTIFDLSAGAYTVTVSDTTNCIVIDSVEIKDPTPIFISFPSDTVFTYCYSDTVDSIPLTIMNNNTPVEYLWSDGSTDSVAYGLEIGWHYVTVTDTLGCSNWDSVYVMRERDYYITFDTVSTVCGDSIGIASAYPIGGTQPYTHEWNTGSTDTAIFNLGVAYYYVTVEDAEGCIISDTVKIEDTSSVNFTVIIEKEVTCEGLPIGIAEIVDIVDATDPVTYLWQNGDERARADSLREGIREVRVIDDSSCVALKQVTMTSDSVLTISGFERSNDVSCNGISNGSLKGIITGGESPYKFLWDTPEADTTEKITGLSPEFYALTVTDINNCEVIDSVEIIEDPLRIEVLNVEHNSCFGYREGVIDIQAIGGFGRALTYEWSSGDSLPNLDSLPAGEYILTITESGLNGCQAVDTVVITEPDGFRRSYTQTAFPSCVDSIGRVELAITGGTAPFSYLWSNGQTDSILTNAWRDYHYITITDANNCDIVDTVEVKDDSPMEMFIYPTKIKCFDSYGSITVEADKGTEPYEYSWNTDTTDTTATIRNLDEGYYFATITDIEGCWRVRSWNLTRPDTINVMMIGDTLIECFGDSSWVQAIATGGTVTDANYSYKWFRNDIDLGYSIDSIERLPAGTYTVAVADEEGCPAEEASFTLKEAGELTPQMDIINTGCSPLEATGQITINNIIGWFEPEFEWVSQEGSILSNDSTLTELVDEIYYLRMFDTLGCSTVKQLTVEPLRISGMIYEDTKKAKCDKYSKDGAIEITSVIGGVEPYTYSWDDGSAGMVASSLTAGIHRVTVTGANNCSEIFQDTVEHYLTVPNFTIRSERGRHNRDSFCTGDSIQLFVDGADPWWTPDYSPESTINFYGWFAEEGTNLDNIRSNDDRSTWVAPDSSTYYYAYRTIDGCSSDTATYRAHEHEWVDLELSPMFESGIEIGTDEEVIAGETIEIRPSNPWFTLQIDDDGFIEYRWNSYDESFNANGLIVDSIFNEDVYDETNNYSLVVVPEESAHYIVIAETRHGCYVSDSVFIKTMPDIFIPSGISPNGDGVNDQWIIPYLKFAPDAHILIFNRWGSKVFESDKNYFGNEWDGTNRKGKPLAVGTYYYKIEFNDAKETETRAGSITIIR